MEDDDDWLPKRSIVKSPVKAPDVALHERTLQAVRSSTRFPGPLAALVLQYARPRFAFFLIGGANEVVSCDGWRSFSSAIRGWSPDVSRWEIIGRHRNAMGGLLGVQGSCIALANDMLFSMGGSYTGPHSTDRASRVLVLDRAVLRAAGMEGQLEEEEDMEKEGAGHYDEEAEEKKDGREPEEEKEREAKSGKKEGKKRRVSRMISLPPMNARRLRGCAAVLNGRLYAFGGHSPGEPAAGTRTR